MLLRTLYELADSRRLFETVHLQSRRLHLLIPINSNGEIQGTGVIPLYSKDQKGKHVLGLEKLMPRFPGENNGGKAYFLAESCLPILGFDKASGNGIPMPKKNPKNPAKSFIHFWNRIQIARDVTGHPILDAMLRFRDRYLYIGDNEQTAHRLPFVETRINDRNGKQEVGALTASGEWIRMDKATLTFQVDGVPVFDGNNLADPLNQYWKQAYGKEAFSDDDATGEDQVHAPTGLCLITERTDAPIARSHKPKLLRIPNIGSGGYIVSFAEECPAFSSYGFKMGENAPVSEEAASSYILALQALIDSENTSLRIGPMLVCFWARESETASTFFAQMLNKPDPRSIVDFLRSPWAGIDRRLANQDRFFSVTLSGNTGRVVIRHWMQTTVDEARKNLAQWFTDLEVAQLSKPEGKKARKSKAGNGAEAIDKEPLTPLALKQLALTTVREEKDLQADVSARLYRAAIEGISPPVTLLKPILYRLNADLQKKFGTETPLNPSRFALIRLILNRNRKESEPMIEPRVFETNDRAYNCGRLLAVLAETQAKAHDFRLEGAGVADRYFGTASVSPSSVFPLLLRLNRHHLDKIRKSDKYRKHVGFIEDDIQSILSLIEPSEAGRAPQFPRHLDLQAQGRFALGFYQQKAASDFSRRAAQ